MAIGVAALMSAGCASVVAKSQSFEGRWTVAAINGKPTPAFALTFAGGQVSGSFGCNSFSGPYRVDEGYLAAVPLAMTQMACASATDEPLPDYESAGLAVMARPMKIEWRGAGRMRLANAGGTLDLKRPD